MYRNPFRILASAWRIQTQSLTGTNLLFFLHRQIGSLFVRCALINHSASRSDCSPFLSGFRLLIRRFRTLSLSRLHTRDSGPHLRTLARTTVAPCVRAHAQSAFTAPPETFSPANPTMCVIPYSSSRYPPRMMGAGTELAGRQFREFPRYGDWKQPISSGHSVSSCRGKLRCGALLNERAPDG